MSKLNKIHREILQCQRCPLCQSRTHSVPGEGSAKANIMFIGEAPGKSEDEQGRPFVGRAGKLLDSLLNTAGLSREQVYITNMVKCRPPDNRDPKAEEVAACEPYLEQQIQSIKPKVIVTLGRHAMMRFLPGQSISRIHGKLHKIDGKTIYPTFHPAAALRFVKWRKVLEEDFKRMPEILNRLTDMVK
jgi:DNA polymerase